MSIERDTALVHLNPIAIDKMQRFRLLLWQESLPFVIFEGLRTQERQEHLWRKGRRADGSVEDPSKVVTNARGTPPRSAHIAGLATDWILDLGSDYWGRMGCEPSGAWDTGVKHGNVLRDGVLGAWMAFGRCAVSVGLEWGGYWKRKGRERDPLGWDPYHVEVRNWRAVAQAYGGVWTP